MPFEILIIYQFSPIEVFAICTFHEFCYISCVMCLYLLIKFHILIKWLKVL